MASGAVCSAQEVDSHGPVMVAGADLSVAFYALRMPEELRHIFGLPVLRAWEAGATELDGVPVKPQARVVPVLAVLPMGWVLALQACQQVHECLAQRLPGISQHNTLVDARTAPRLSGRAVLHTK